MCEHSTIFERQPSQTIVKGDYRLTFTPDFDRVPDGLALWQGAGDGVEQRLDEALHRAITTALTDKQREVIRCFFFEGLSQGEIARRLGVSQQVVHKRIYGVVRRGRRVGGALHRLRTFLKAEGLAPGESI